MNALLEIFLNGGLHYDATTEQAAVSPVAGSCGPGSRPVSSARSTRR